MIPTDRAARSGYVRCAGREIHYLDWGDAVDPVVVAWHGLARTSRDMDELARHLVARGWRVVCPDMIGRGLSQWSAHPEDEYQLRFYARIASDFFEALDIARACWIGTSMGGAIGTVCASGLFEPQLKSRIAALILNDNAPQLARTAIDRIRDYAQQPPVFDSMAEMESYFRSIYRSFGHLSDVEWRLVAESSTRRLPDGRLTTHYDPRIVRQFIDHPDDYELWPHYDRVECPVLCLRGVESELVRPETTTEMLQRGPGARGLATVVEVPGCGHAPALNVPAQWAPIDAFLPEPASWAVPGTSRVPRNLKVRRRIIN